MRNGAKAVGIAVLVIFCASSLAAGGKLSFGTAVAKTSLTGVPGSIPLDLSFDHIQGLAALQFRVTAPGRDITLAGVVPGPALGGPADWACASNVVHGITDDTLIVVLWCRTLQGLQPGAYPGFLSVTFTRKPGEQQPMSTPRMRLSDIVSALSGSQGGAGSISVGDTPTALVVVETPMEFRLDQNYPNPFNPSTVIQFASPGEGHARIAVFNMIGQEIATAFDAPVEGGSHSIRFDASHLPAGIYLYRLTIGRFVATRSMVLLR
jgi:hypothetical protein